MWVMIRKIGKLDKLLHDGEELLPNNHPENIEALCCFESNVWCFSYLPICVNKMVHAQPSPVRMYTCFQLQHFTRKNKHVPQWNVSPSPENNIHPSWKSMTKNVKLSQKKKYQTRLRIPLFRSPFPACVTCCCWATSLDHISEAAVMPDIGMKCTPGQNLSLFWHPVFTVTVMRWGWKACGCHADPQEWSDPHWGLSVTSGHVSVCTAHAVNHASAYAACRACRRIQCGWLADICVWSHATNFQSVPAN